MVIARMVHKSGASSQQFATILEFMQRHGDIGKSAQDVQGRTKSDQLWQELEGLLNSISGGAVKSMDKWKKVWADWKAQTKKKSLALQRRSPMAKDSLRQTLKAGNQNGILQRRLHKSPPPKDFILPPSIDSIKIQPPSETVKADTVLNITPVNNKENSEPTAPNEASRLSESIKLSPDPGPTPLSAKKYSYSTPLSGVTRRRGRLVNRSALNRIHRHRWRAKRILTPFERATKDFISIENRRLQFELERERYSHEREMERLRMESRKIEIEENRNQTFIRLAGVLENLTETISMLRPTIPYADVLHIKS